ncbi:MAG TPA: rhodanese-like domain-containing protein [Acidimicrobiales bacterium]|jgi:rhodanese-related sulfurtransferase
MVAASRTDELLAAARLGLRRVGPDQAAELAANGGILVDIRPMAQRAAHGEIPGALVVDRNVLEWRLDPSSPHRLPSVDATVATRPVVVVCQEGYASSLAAASLQAVGLAGATDLAGGFAAWAAAGLPVKAFPPDAF